MEKIIYSLIVPVFNEQEVLHAFYERASKVMQGLDGPYEILFVDDGSVDNTRDMLRELCGRDKNVRALLFTHNFGHQLAVSAGMAHCAGDMAVIIDADLQDPPELIPEMVRLHREGYQIVYGKRTVRKGETAFKKLTAHMYYRVLKSLSATPIPLDTGDFRLIGRDVIDSMNAMPEHNRFLRGMAAWTGYSQVALPYERDARFAGKTKYSLQKMLKLAGDGLVAFSNRPLKLAAGVGMAVCALSCAYFLVSLILTLATFGFNGLHMLFAGVFFFMGVILCAIGILGAYTGRIYDEAKSRPLYMVQMKMNFIDEE